MSDKKITESQVHEFYRAYVGTRGTVLEMVRSGLEALGFEIVPDPMPEPEGQVIVRDLSGDVYMRVDSLWHDLRDRTVWSWKELQHYAPLKVYRLEGDGNE